MATISGRQRQAGASFIIGEIKGYIPSSWRCFSPTLGKEIHGQASSQQATEKKEGFDGLANGKQTPWSFIIIYLFILMTVCLF